MLLEKFILQKYTLPPCPAEFLDITIDENKVQDESGKVLDIVFPFAKSPVISSDLKDSKVLVEGEGLKKVIEISLDAKDLPSFYPGDTIGVLTENLSEDVDFFLDHLGLSNSADNECSLSIKKNTTKKAAKIPFSQITTPRQILRDYLNFRSIPKKLFLRSLVEYTENPSERHFLGTLSSKEGAKLYSELTGEKKKTFVEILKSCPSCKPSLSLLIEHLPKLLPRPYSLANSHLKSPDIKVIFSVLEENPGLTTSLMEKSPETLRIYLREPNHFRYSDEDFEKNQIMISVGCGVAPFIGFLEHKEELLKLKENKGKSWLFNGVRCKESSIYRERFIEFKASGVLDKFFESYSRDEECKYKYVQDQIVGNEESFVKLLLKEETVLFVCADGAGISKGVEECISKCLERVLAIDDVQSKELVLKFKKERKYREDLWV
ncbi:MTRR family protein [Megaselia abdita]